MEFLLPYNGFFLFSSVAISLDVNTELSCKYYQVNVNLQQVSICTLKTICVCARAFHWNFSVLAEVPNYLLNVLINSHC